MLLLARIKNFYLMAGYARAASVLATQGHYAEAQKLMLEKYKLLNYKEKAIVRLERVKSIKSHYEPGDHYMRGKKVAFWKGKAA